MPNVCFSVGVVLSLVSTVGIIYALASKMWKQNSQVESQGSTYGIHSYEGLWVRCTIPVPGQISCDQYDESFLGLPADLQGQRAMMVIATILAVFGFIAGTVGMDCITAMQGTKSKTWTGRSGGGMMLLAGVLTVAAVSWYAAGVAAQYYNNAAQNQSQTFVYVFGSALYVGWIAGALAIISGILLACCNCAGGEDVEESYRYNYKPASKPATRAAEYV